MEVYGVSSQSGSSRVVKKDIVDKDTFLKILTVELANQDPLNAKDNTEYIAQLAQFTSLEQAQNMNSSITKLLLSQRFTEGAMLIGKNVEFSSYDSNGDAELVNEVVKSVKIEDGDVYLITENNKYNIDNVTGVGDVEVDNES